MSQRSSAPLSAGADTLPAVETVGVPSPHPVSQTLRGFRVRGDCMEPEIRDGDVAVVDLEAECRPGDIVAAVRGGEILVRLLLDEDGLLYLVDNIANRIPAESFAVGRVGWIRRDVRSEARRSLDSAEEVTRS